MFALFALAIGVFCVVAALIVLAVAVAQARVLRVTRLHVTVPHWPPHAGRVRIAHLSDLHLPHTPVPLERLVGAVTDIDPHVIVVSGDTVSWNADIDTAASTIRRLAEHAPVLCVSGNTEHMYGLDIPAFAAAVEHAGGVLLRDQHWSETLSGAKVCVLGLEYRRDAAPDIGSVLAEAPAADLTIVLAHSPSVWPHVPRERAHLLLCGHTHGGQLRIPLLGPMIAHSRIEWELKSGIFELPRQGGDWGSLRRVFTHEELCRDDSVRRHRLRRGRPLMCVTRGVGSVLLAARLGSPPEVIGITAGGETAGDSGGDTEGG
jgi:hypothetical protein